MKGHGAESDKEHQTCISCVQKAVPTNRGDTHIPGMPGRDVLLEQSVEGVVQCGADKVATCIHPSRKHGELEDINSKSCNGQVLPRQRMGGKNHLPQPFIVSQAFYQAFGNGLYIKHD